MAEGRFRQRSVESVIKIVNHVVAEFGARRLRFEHDLLTLNRKWILELCEALIREKLVKPWSCFSRIDTVDDESSRKCPKQDAIKYFTGSKQAHRGCSEL